MFASVLSPRIYRYRGHLLKYAGEFVIIFCSITFTWWFDEWRQEQNDRKEEARLLINLRSNLDLDSINLNSELNYILKSKYTFDSFLDKLEKKNFTDSDSSGFLLRKLIVAPEFHPNKATFEAIKSTGELKLIQDDTLALSIMNLYEVTYQELNFLIEIYNQTSIQTIWNYSIENHDLLRVLGAPEERIFKFEFNDDKERQLLINKIMFTEMAVVYSKFRLNRTLDQIRDLKSRINRRLLELG